MLRSNLLGLSECALRVALVAAAILIGKPLAAQEAKPDAEKGDAGRRQAIAQRHLRKALESPTTLEFIETPLKDVVDYLKDLHGIEIQIDQRALDGVGVSSDSPVTRNLKGISLRSALTLMLKELELTYCIQHEVIQVTTRDAVDSQVSVQTYSAADIADDEAAATALTKVVEMTLDPPVEPAEGVKPPPPGQRVVMLRGLLVVRGNPREQERIEELLCNIRRKLKLPDPFGP